MEVAANFIMVLYGVGIFSALILLVYLIFKRQKDKKSENFEKREN